MATLRNSDGSQDIDAFVRMRAHRIEVKNEENFRYKNLCIEAFQGTEQKPSGIYTSRSTVYVHLFSGEQAVLYVTQKMKELIRAEFAGYKIRFANADNNNSGYLIPIARVANEPWCEQRPLQELAYSRVFDW